MDFKNSRSFKILAPGGSLRRRTAMSLAVVRLILVPVIVLAVFYLFKMGLIVNRIVRLDAPTARLAEQTSVALLEARRAERNYFLLHDAGYIRSNAEDVARAKTAMKQIGDLDCRDKQSVQEGLEYVSLYKRQFAFVTSPSVETASNRNRRLQATVKAYEAGLNRLLARGKRESRPRLMEELHSWADHFDQEIVKAAEAGDPGLRQATLDLQASSQGGLRVASDLEKLSWRHIESDYEEARQLTNRAKWTISLTSAVTLLLSIWISFMLPQRVVKPLIDLRAAVDHAAAGNYEIDFELYGEGEVVDLARSVGNLIAHVRQQHFVNARP